MEFFHGRTDIDFIGKRYPAFLVSGTLVVGSLALIAFKGLNYSIEFTGGTLVQVGFARPVALAELRERLEREYPGLDIQSFSGNSSFILKAKGEAEQVEAAAGRIEEVAKKAFPDNAVTIERREFVGPVVGKHLYKRTLAAIILSLLGIVVYVAFRFENPVWGVAGVLALGHDVIGTVGLFALTGKEMDLLIVASLLTIAGYSINDTIVIFDRMREKIRQMRRAPIDQIINESVNETLSRTIITVLTVQMVVTVLFFFGGEVIHDFATALLFGGFIGSYSTIAVAAPLVYEWKRLGDDRRA